MPSSSSADKSKTNQPKTTRPQNKAGQSARPRREDNGPILITALMMLAVAWTISQWLPKQIQGQFGEAEWASYPIPLVMEGGDPYIRALMRTISASESNTTRPYNVIYGGKEVSNLDRHPDDCVEIVSGPNMGDCSTAAGRYQFLTTTWLDKAQHYHPHPPGWYHFWTDYSFEPTYQDIVVYRWLTDTQAWGVDISALLRDGQIDRVLEMLSGTWTSLGYGIEDNSMTPYLSELYNQILAEELSNSSASR